MKKVVICQHRLLHYREGFFNQLHDLCAARGIDLSLVHGQPSKRELIKNDEGFLPWSVKVKNLIWNAGNRDLLWQPFPNQLKDADLVILIQENRILSNYFLILSRLFLPRKVAYWGHGVNFQSDAPQGLSEKWKRFLLNHVDWWFAYTGMTVKKLIESGYPCDRITCLNNAIDNNAFEKDLLTVTESCLEKIKSEISTDVYSPIGIFCGSLYPDKKLDFLMSAADKIHAAIPGFRLVIIGDGPSSKDIEEAAVSRTWLKWVGVKKGAEKAAYFKLASVVLNPGLVGLHVLDSFCAGTPMITTSEARHSPEIEYLHNNTNGLIISGDATVYAAAVINLLQNPQKLSSLKEAALSDAKKYTLSNMVNNFIDGIEKCLDMPKK